MIGKLKGRIDSFGTDWLIIDVSGVGYHVFCSSKTLAALPSVGEFAELHTEMLVSQDMIRLVGFASMLEREWFRLLQTVQGVGTRVALAILSTLSASEIANAIALQDKPTIDRAPGVERQGAGVYGGGCNACQIAGGARGAAPNLGFGCGVGPCQLGLRPKPGGFGGCRRHAQKRR